MLPLLKKKFSRQELFLLCFPALASILLATGQLMHERSPSNENRVHHNANFSIEFMAWSKVVIPFEKTSVYLAITALMILSTICLLLRNNLGLILSGLFGVGGLFLLVTFDGLEKSLYTNNPGAQLTEYDRQTFWLKTTLTLLLFGEILIFCKTMWGKNISSNGQARN